MSLLCAVTLNSAYIDERDLVRCKVSELSDCLLLKSTDPEVEQPIAR